VGTRLPFAVAAVVLIVGIYVALLLSLDFGGGDLGRSLATEAGASGYVECYRERDGGWGCTLFAGRSRAEYVAVQTNGDCWRARRERGVGRSSALPRSLHGCLDPLEAVRNSGAWGAQEKYPTI
jgi:hypothetical protein